MPRCPRCGWRFVRRAQRAGFIERLLSLFNIYPFRCQTCSWRFRALVFGLRFARRRPPDRREYDRLPVSIPATFTGSGVNGAGMVTTISVAGCTLAVEPPPDPGALLTLALAIADSEPPVTMEASVVHAIHSGTAGLAFLQFRGGDEARLRQFVHRLIVARQR